MIRLIIITMCVLSAAIPQSNTSIDATEETRELNRKILTGTSGGSGQSLPIELKTVIVNGGQHQGDQLFLDFIITNRSQQALMLPISPHAHDVEPTDSEPSAFDRLNLFLTAGNGTTPVLLKGGANLYGASRLPGTQQTLRPSESLIVHTKFLLASWDGPLSGTQTLRGHVSLLHETLKPHGTDLESISDEAGSATGPTFSWTIGSVK